jgi:outer membrane protein assembly factor BamD (BamD/ComL family)
MMVGMRVALVLVAVLASACTRWAARPDHDTTETPSTAALLAVAQRDAEAGRAREANARYEAIVRERPGDPLAAEALHRLAVLRIDPASPLRDRRIAQTLFRRLAHDYPDTPQGHEARSWRVVLRELDRCEVEATRRGADAEQLRQTLESIKDSDLELEQNP